MYRTLFKRAPPNLRKPIFSRCLPDVTSTADAIIGALGIGDVVTDIVADIKISWKEILYMSLIALGRVIHRVPATQGRGFVFKLLHLSICCVVALHDAEDAET